MAKKRVHEIAKAQGLTSKELLVKLKAAGITLFQGYWFAKPAFEALPEIDMSIRATHRTSRSLVA